MDEATYSRIVSFIWGIADDCLRDLYVRGKYRDVILAMTVIRRLDAVLEGTKPAVLAMKAALDESGFVHQTQALRDAAGHAFYNTSKFTLRDLKNRAKRGQLEADFRNYPDGFSPNVQETIDNFEFRNQFARLSRADTLGTLIEKLLDPAINLSPNPVRNGDGSVKHPGLDNHAIGTNFEELVRRFNEENNEEVGEHWTPRDAGIVRREDDVDPALGAFAFKRVKGRRGRVELVPQSHDQSYPRLELQPGDRFIARLVRPLDWHQPRSAGAT